MKSLKNMVVGGFVIIVSISLTSCSSNDSDSPEPKPAPAETSRLTAEELSSKITDELTRQKISDLSPEYISCYAKVLTDSELSDEYLENFAENPDLFDLDNVSKKDQKVLLTEKFDLSFNPCFGIAETRVKTDKGPEAISCIEQPNTYSGSEWLETAKPEDPDCSTQNGASSFNDDESYLSRY